MLVSVDKVIIICAVALGMGRMDWVLDWVGGAPGAWRENGCGDGWVICISWWVTSELQVVSGGEIAVGCRSWVRDLWECLRYATHVVRRKYCRHGTC